MSGSKDQEKCVHGHYRHFIYFLFFKIRILLVHALELVILCLRLLSAEIMSATYTTPFDIGFDVAQASFELILKPRVTLKF